MYDSQIAEELRKTYGEEKYRIYCEMQVARHNMAQDELSRLNESPDESYDRYFWKIKLDELNKPETK
jgi:siroheme synthase